MEETIIVNTYANEIYSKTEILMNYVNNKDNPIELIIEIPMRAELIFESFIAKIKDQIIKSKIIETEKAEEKYTDAISKGDTGVTTSYNLEDKLYTVKIGNLPSKETLELRCFFLQFVSIKNGFYCLNILKDYPKILNFTPNQIKGEIIIETNSEIINIEPNIGSFCKEDKAKYRINYDNNNTIEKILFKTQNMVSPLLMSQYNPSSNETNYIFNTLIEKEEKFKDKIYPCLFIIIIDQSGSMHDSIKNVSETLSNLIESFPQGSYYQLIGFGNYYKKYDLKPKINTQENINNSKEIINSLSADMGGTNLSLPLKDILKDSYKDYENITLSKQIIILTDGEIELGEETTELIGLHNNEFKIHLIGIGSEVNKNSIINISKAGNGSYFFIDDSSDLKKVIFELLNKCTNEYIKNYKFILNNNKFIYELQPINKTTYSNDSMYFCFIKENKSVYDIDIRFTWENYEEKFEKDLQFKQDNIIKLPEGEELSKLIMGLSFKYGIIKEQKDEILLSKKYQVLSKYTTLFAELENNEKINNKMETFKNEKEKVINYSRGFNCFCGKSFLSKIALSNHINIKHSSPNMLKKGRGRPRKYPSKSNIDFENGKYDNYFESSERKTEEGKSIDIISLVQEVFDFIYKGKYSEKLVSKYDKSEDNPILINLLEGKETVIKPNKEKTSDEIFYEYLSLFKDKTNQNYFSFMVKFILIFREFYIKKNKENPNKEKLDKKKSILEEVPDSCNEFYGGFLEGNNFFGLNDEDEKKEIIELIQHFGIWLFKNGYTSSKLSLAEP